MAVNLSAKNVPYDLAHRFRERAQRHHRSLRGELDMQRKFVLGPGDAAILFAARRLGAAAVSSEDMWHGARRGVLVLDRFTEAN